jgi:flagellar motor switch protein FliN/FliY
MNTPTTCQPNLEGFLDMPVNLTVELGACFKSTREILRLGIDSVVTLDQRSGGPVDLYIERRLVAKGEIVMTEGSMAIKVTEIIANRGTKTESCAASIA